MATKEGSGGGSWLPSFRARHIPRYRPLTATPIAAALAGALALASACTTATSEPTRRSSTERVPAVSETPGASSPDRVHLAERVQRTRAIITGFAQGPAGNCTSIGFIKAVLRAYGSPDNLFHFKRSPQGGLDVTTLSGVRLSLSADELHRAATAAALRLNSPDAERLRDSANQMFAVMGKACQRDCARPPDAQQKYCAYAEGERCTFAGALTYLDSGLDWWVPPALLGMTEGRDFRQIAGWVGGRWFRSVRFTAGDQSCVAATRRHTFFVADGLADKGGRPVDFRSKLASWFAFKSIGAYCLIGGHESATAEMTEALPDGQPPADALDDPELRDI